MVRVRLVYAFLVAVLVTGILAAVPAGSAAPVAHAADTFTVDTTDDIDGSCAVAGQCSLRGAVSAANDTSGATVVVPAGRYVLTQGQLTLSQPMTVTGAALPPGPRASTIDAGGGSRVFEVAAADVTISGLVITGGDVRAAKQKDSTGGGIYVGRQASLGLQDSTVVGNAAVDGGGLANDGTVAVSASTFADNDATGKGGAIQNSGTSQVDNSTFIGNTAAQGGALNSPGATDVVHATIVQNVAGSSSSGGIDRNGGTLRVSYSIIANNFRSNGAEASDCSGTPDLLLMNLVSDTQGCNPVGEIIEADPVVAGLADNGGPTQTVALLEGSPAIDATTQPCALDVDQRGTARPTGDGCDLGAYEVAPLAATFSLDVDTTAYEADGYPAGTVEVGAVTVPTDAILDELVNQDQASSVDAPADTALRSIALRSIALRSIALRSIDLNSTALRSIPLRSIGLEALALRSIALRSIELESAALRSIALRSIPLSEIPLDEPGGWDAVLAGTSFEDLPLQAVTLEDLVQGGVELGDLTLAELSLEASALRSIALRSILLADAALRSIPLSDDLAAATDEERIAAWCEALGDVCDGEGQLTSAELGGLDLLSVQLAGIGVDDVPIFDIPLDGFSATALRSIPLRSIALRSIDLTSTALRSIALRSIALRSIDTVDALVDCSAATGDPQYCSTDPTNELTLGDAVEAGDLRDADVGALIDAVSDVVVGCADEATRADIGEQACALVESLSFGDLLLAFVQPGDPGWESLDLDSALLQNIADPLQQAFVYEATIGITNGPADVDLTLLLPAGFAAARAATDDPATLDGEAIEPVDGDLSMVRFSIPAVANGTYTLRVPVRAGLTIGDFTASATLDARQGDQGPGLLEDDATVTVVEASEDDSAGASVPLSLDGPEELQLAHISRSDDADLYSFVVPEGLSGAQARLLLSNVPSAADYDLVVYAPAPEPLRNEPTQELSSLGDIGFDLSPADDVYSTDVVDDIQLSLLEQRDISGYTVRDTSTKRVDEDEEVTTGPLQGGATYYVAVTSYNQSLSPQPYGLRVRVDGAVDLPACAAPRFDEVALPEPQAIDVPSDATTLYVTNTQWLAASEVDVTDVLAAIDGTAGVNGEVPGLVAVDSDAQIRGLYASWDANRCDPLARNAIVTEIGALLDTILDNRPDVDSVVLVGGDGVVPMAAVPDLTAYSNESTFAAETTFGGASNEVSAALANGYLLTDDPYATPAGIAIQGGDHELFMPEVDLGRLVETGPQIVDQLTSFAAFDGQLDAGTTGALTAGVTGYDFLDDGAEAVAAELDAVDDDGAARLISAADAPLPDRWNRQDFLDFLEAEDYQVLSPNAHYDFESLLPAQDDGQLFSADDLVVTSDVDTPLRLPTNALILTMGCHAGLSVDDVQVGLAVPDWAQTFAGDAVYAAHTTYGYGDTEIVAYSERLSEIYARNVAAHVTGAPGAPESIGAALREAKREYLDTTLVLTPYDEKILQSMTTYGLPMYRMGGSTAPLAAAAAVEEQPSAITFAAADEAGVVPVEVRLTETIDDRGPTNVNLVGTPEGDYFEVDGNVVAGQYRPLQPLVEAELPDGNPPAAGLLITGLDSRDLEGFDPLYLQPTLDLGFNEGRIEPADGSFPASLQRVTPQAAGAPQRLLVAAGQFQDPIEGPGVQRVFTAIDGELYPVEHAGTTDAPGFTRVLGRVGEDEAVVQFDVGVDGPAERVYVLFREVPAGGFGGATTSWRGVDLVPASSSSTTWLGGETISSAGATVEFFVQAVGANGRVSISDNKVYNYLSALPDETNSLTIALDGPLGQNGYYTGPVTARVVDDVAGVEYSVDAGEFQAAAEGVTVSDNGGHVVLARDSSGGREFVFVVIDQDGPTVTADTFAPDSGDSVTVSLTARDIGQSGVASITYTVTPPSGEPTETVVDGTAAPQIVITDPGTTLVEAYATDRAGNETALDSRVSIEVFLDNAPPEVTATLSPEAAADGWVNQDVVVTVRATDESDVATITIDGSTTTIEPPTSPAEASTTVTSDGETTVTYAATDTSGNDSEPASALVRIDTVDPNASVTVLPAPDDDNGVLEFGEPAFAEYVCEDGLSGVAECIVSVDGVVVDDSDGDGRVALSTATVGAQVVEVRATDNAGNVATATQTFGVYRVCLDYDPDQAKNIGSNYTIKLNLCDPDGTPIGNRRFTLTAVSIDDVADPGPNDSGNANDGYLFRYRSGGFIYNLDTTGLPAQGIGPGRHYLVFEIETPSGFVTTATAPFTLS
jgi:CSLREA domain-containing protein